MRIGFFGGSFDPVHKAHLALAESALRRLKLDRIYFVPAARSPFKPGGARASASHRLKMLRLAVKGRPAFRVSPWEINHPGVSYTYRTLRAFRRRFPKARWFLLLGGDALAGFTRWRNWREILENSGLAAAPRRGVRQSVPAPLRGKVVFLKMPPKMASSELRRELAEGRFPKRLVPPSVAEYIDKHRLYRALTRPSDTLSTHQALMERKSHRTMKRGGRPLAPTRLSGRGRGEGAL